MINLYQSIKKEHFVMLHPVRVRNTYPMISWSCNNWWLQRCVSLWIVNKAVSYPPRNKLRDCNIQEFRFKKKQNKKTKKNVTEKKIAPSFFHVFSSSSKTKMSKLNQCCGALIRGITFCEISHNFKMKILQFFSFEMRRGKLNMLFFKNRLLIFKS